MRHVDSIEFRLIPGKMEAFTRAVQQWERVALSDPDGPEHHSVLVDEAQPERVVILTQFAGPDHAERFHKGELRRRLDESIGACCTGSPSTNRYTLYYSAGSSGARAVFGEDPGT